MKMKCLIIAIVLAIILVPQPKAKADFIYGGVDYQYFDLDFSKDFRKSSRHMANYYVGFKLVPVPLVNLFLELGYANSFNNGYRVNNGGLVESIKDEIRMLNANLIYKFEIKKLSVLAMGSYSFVFPDYKGNYEKSYGDKMFHLYGFGAGLEYELFRFAFIRLMGRMLFSSSSVMDRDSFSFTINAGLGLKF